MGERDQQNRKSNLIKNSPDKWIKTKKREEKEEREGGGGGNGIGASHLISRLLTLFITLSWKQDKRAKAKTFRDFFSFFF